MCTSLTFKTSDFYFARNMDLDYHFGERVVITPRGYPLSFKHEKSDNNHYAIIGMATIQKNYPLYAEGANERGLCISALNFEGNAYYQSDINPQKVNLSSYEIIPYILSKCATAIEARAMLENCQIVSTPFDESTGTSPLHYLISDSSSSIVLESTRNGIKIYDNPLGILTNNPTFDFHLSNICLYAHLKVSPPKESDIGLSMSAFGLPGDFSSTSRFVKLAFLKKYISSQTDEKSSVETAFRMMYSVSPLRGCVLTKNNRPHYTTYTCVINATKGVYYYTTSEDLTIRSVSLFDIDINSSQLCEYDLKHQKSTEYLNIIKNIEK